MPYVPLAYRQRADFDPRPAAAIPPQEIREVRLTDVLAPKANVAAVRLNAATPSLVLLPPQFRETSSPPQQAAAEFGR